MIDDVPDAPSGAVVDPHWLALQPSGTQLPTFYLPSSMSGQVTGWRRVTVWTVIVLLVSAAGSGICLTYGPDELLRIVGL